MSACPSPPLGARFQEIMTIYNVSQPSQGGNADDPQSSTKACAQNMCSNLLRQARTCAPSHHRTKGPTLPSAVDHGGGRQEPDVSDLGAEKA